MKLRKLKQDDAEYMLEWMHDPNVIQGLQKDFAHMNIDDCGRFIWLAQDTEESLHLAICNDEDIYQGTISLKNIDREHGRAEYAISCRSCAIGKGFAREATRELFRIAREELGLKFIYLNVYDFNVRAQKMYLKTGFEQMEKPDFIRGEDSENLLWFGKQL